MPSWRSQSSAASTCDASPSSSQTIHPRCSSTSARRMLGSTSNWRTSVARTARRTSDSGNVSFTRTWLTSAPRVDARLGRVQHPVHAARAEAFQVQRHKAKPGRSHRRHHLVPAGQHLGEHLGSNSSRAAAPWWRTRSCPNPSARSADSAASTACEAAERDRSAIGQAGGQAGRGRLVPGAQAELLRPVPDVLLGEAGLRPGGRSLRAAAAAAWPGRWSPRSLTLTPSTTRADSARANGPSADIKAVLQRAHRSAPLAT